VKSLPEREFLLNPGVLVVAVFITQAIQQMVQVALAAIQNQLL
jgi:hypothetical protein